MQWPIVDAFAAQRSARFAQVDAHLVSATSIETTLDEGVTSEFFEQANMRDRSFSLLGFGRAATTSITAIANQVRLNSSGHRGAADDCQIAPFDCVRAKLLAEESSGCWSASEDD